MRAHVERQLDIVTGLLQEKTSSGAPGKKKSAHDLNFIQCLATIQQELGLALSTPDYVDTAHLSEALVYMESIGQVAGRFDSLRVFGSSPSSKPSLAGRVAAGGMPVFSKTPYCLTTETTLDAALPLTSSSIDALLPIYHELSGVATHIHSYEPNEKGVIDSPAIREWQDLILHGSGGDSPKEAYKDYARDMAIEGQRHFKAVGENLSPEEAPRAVESAIESAIDALIAKSTYTDEEKPYIKEYISSIGQAHGTITNIISTTTTSAEGNQSTLVPALFGDRTYDWRVEEGKIVLKTNWTVTGLNKTDSDASGEVTDACVVIGTPEGKLIPLPDSMSSNPTIPICSLSATVTLKVQSPREEASAALIAKDLAGPATEMTSFDEAEDLIFEGLDRRRVVPYITSLQMDSFSQDFPVPAPTGRQDSEVEEVEDSQSYSRRP